MANDVTTGVRTEEVRLESPKPTTLQEKEATISSKTKAQTNVELSNRQEKLPETKTVDDAVKTLNSVVQDVRRELQFRVEENSGKTIITVLDQDSEEIIRQIPAEEVVRMAQFLKELGNNDDDQTKLLNGLILELRA